MCFCTRQSRVFSSEYAVEPPQPAARTTTRARPRTLNLTPPIVRTLPQSPFDEEQHVRRPLGEPPHQVRVPVRPERRGDEHPAAPADEVLLQLRADAVEHLQLHPVVADPERER